MVNQTLDRYVVNGHTNSEEDIERAQNEILLQTWVDVAWVVVVELRSYFCALLQNYINIKKSTFVMVIKLKNGERVRPSA